MNKIFVLGCLIYTYVIYAGDDAQDLNTSRMSRVSPFLSREAHELLMAIKAGDIVAAQTLLRHNDQLLDANWMDFEQAYQSASPRMKNLLNGYITTSSAGRASPRSLNSSMSFGSDYDQEAVRPLVQTDSHTVVRSNSHSVASDDRTTPADFHDLTFGDLRGFSFMRYYRKLLFTLCGGVIGYMIYKIAYKKDPKADQPAKEDDSKDMSLDDKGPVKRRG